MSRNDLVTRYGIRGAKGVSSADVSVIEANLAAFSSLPVMDVDGIRFSIQTYEEMKANSVVTITASAKNPSALERGTPHDPQLGVVATNGTCERCTMDAASCNGGHFGLIEFHTYLPPPEKNLSMILKLLISMVCAGCGRLTMSDAALRGIRNSAEKTQSTMNATNWHFSLLESIAESSLNAFCYYQSDKEGHKNQVVRSLKPKTEPFTVAPYVEGSVKREAHAPNTSFPLEFYYAAFERLTPAQLYYLGYADRVGEEYVVRTHPKALIARAAPVTPLCSRAPMVADDAANTSFHPITKGYNKLIDAANNLRAAQDELRALEADLGRGGTVSAEFVAKSRSTVQMKTNALNLVFIENYETIMKSILSNKNSGFMRGESQGKVVSFIARTTVVPDPRNRAGEISIPNKMRNKISTRVTVTNSNIAELTKKLREGKVRMIHPHTAIIQGSTINVTPANRGSLVIQVGDEVSRDLEVGDYLLFIRQPVLGGLNLISNKIVRFWDSLAFGFSPEEVEIRAMDFDGDQAQGLSPQSTSAMAELMSINSAPQLLINPKDQALVFGMHQDGTLGSVIMTTNPLKEGQEVTDDKGWVTRRMFERIASLVSTRCKNDISKEGQRLGIADRLVDFQRRLTKWDKVFSMVDEKEGEVVPTDVLLSWAFPADTVYRSPSVDIRDGIIVRGIVDKSVLGRTQDTLLHYIAETDRDYALTVMKDVTIVAQSFLSFYGMSGGYKDCAPAQGESQQIIGMELGRMTARLEQLADPVDERDVRRYQDELLTIIAETSGKVDQAIMGGLTPDNRIMKIIRSGAKGTERHLYNIAGIIGQQYVAGNLPTRMMAGGTKYDWYFDAADREPTSMGMCTSSLSHGITPAEAIHIASAARMSFINLHLTTPDVGQKSNEMYRVLQGVITNIEGSCVDNDRVLSSLYGGDGLAPDRLTRIRQASGALAVRFANIGSFVDELMAEEGWYPSTE